MLRRLSNFLRLYPYILRLPYYVYRLFQTRYTLGVVGVILNQQGEVLIVEHVFHPEHPWGLPGGWIGHDEDPACAVVRELQEELQLDAQVVHTLLIEKSFRNHVDIAFLCETSCNVGDISKELLDYRWVKPSALPFLHKFHAKAINKAIEQYHRSQV